MMFRALACCAVLGLSALLSQTASAAPDCSGPECGKAAPAKPLNIMQFMREQAASTRAAEPRQRKARKPSAAARRAAPRAVAVQSKPVKQHAKRPTPSPVEASETFASERSRNAPPPPDVQVVTGDELNAIDRAAAGQRGAETVGAGTSTGPAVQLVDAEQVNDIDRNAPDNSPSGADAATSPGADAPPRVEPASPSWWQRIWSALGSTLTALASAVHHLIG